MERRFGLQGINTRGDATECLITSIAPVGEGFAAHCWTLAGNDESRPRKDLGELLLSFNLQMRYRGEARPYNIEAALAFLFRDDNRVLFRGDDFYVPPGLWGIGIGESFLNALIDRQSPLFEGNAELAGVDTFVVAIEQKRGERGVIRKTGADMTAMYRTAGFTCTSPASLGERGWSPLLETVNVAGNDDVRLLIRQLPKLHP